MDMQPQPVAQAVPTKKHGVLKIVLAAATFIVIVFILPSIFPGLFTVPLLKVKFPASKYPGLYLSLTPRTVATDNQARETQYSYFGIQFNEPWGNPATTTDRRSDLGLVQFQFTDNRFITLGDPTREISLLPIFGSNDFKNDEALLGSDAVASEFNFYQAVLNTNLDQLSVFNRHDAVSGSVLITYKLLLQGMTMLSSTNDKIYFFKTNIIEGFQFGDPTLDKGVFVDVFDARGENHHWLTLGGTQSEIDDVLGSITLTPSQ